MGVHSGKFGVVDGADTVQAWTINHTSALAQFYASNTMGGAARRKGIHSWAGSYTRLSANLLHLPGQFFNFSGYTAPSDDVLGSNGVVYSGSAIVDSVAITWDWTGANIISQVVSFSGHLVLASAAGILEDETVPDGPEVAGTKIQYGADIASSQTLWQNLASATLTLSAANQSYVNSSTYDVTSGKVWTGRKPGNFDWNLAVTVQDDNEATFPGLDTQLGFRVFADAATYWQLLWGRARDITGITVDRQSGAIIQGTTTIEMDGVKEGTGAIGSVTAPDGTQIWPTVVGP